MKFESTFVTSLPGDPKRLNQSRLVENACYSLVSPTPVAAPKMLSYSKELCEQLGVPQSWIESDEALQVLSGNHVLDGMMPYAMCYGGHQFGNWAGQLGDGRAINLGELKATDGTSWTWQLKGAGKTPYSRFADGLAVLRSSLREYACSEAMHFLGVPTTRALSLVETGEQVVRDMFYDGNAKPEPGAIVCRVAPNFIRFGNFEIQTARGRIDLLQKLADFTIEQSYPHLAPSQHSGSPAERYASWFTEVCQRTAWMIIEWMRVGFVHGVMNTDNMSILGLTIDYGPYGWVDNFDPNWTPNTTDFQHHRYAFGNQPQIGQWNLMQLANALYPLIEQVEPLQAGLDRYVETMSTGHSMMMADKLGLGVDPSVSPHHSPADHHSSVQNCIEGLENLWKNFEIDMTLFFRLLGRLPKTWTDQQAPETDVLREFQQTLSPSFYRAEQLETVRSEVLWDWVKLYRQALRESESNWESRVQRMNLANPKYVLRNYLAQQAIDAADGGDLSVLNTLMKLLRAPYDEQPEFESQYFVKRPDWARSRPGCSTLSCSS